LFSTVITAAGKSDSSYGKRFPGIPKNLVTISGVPMLARSAASYSHAMSENIVAMVNQVEDVSHQTSLVLSKHCKNLTVETLKTPVRGALITAILASANLPPDKPLIVAGGDSEILNGIQNKVERFMSRKLSGGVIVFRDLNPRWSYVQAGRSLEVIQVSEKRVIGEFATTGVFYFESLRKFLDAAEWCLVNNAQTGGDFYVSAALNHLISQGGKVGYEEIEKSNYKNYRFAEDVRDDI
jgi:hypothetical protein